MQTTVLERVKQAVNYLIFVNNLDNDKELATKMGYASAYLSHLKTGKVALSDKFIQNLAKMDGNIDKNYIATGEGKLLKNSSIDTIKHLEREITTKDELIEALKKQIQLLENR